jgi:phosphate transport system substrate-binding protein
MRSETLNEPPASRQLFSLQEQHLLRNRTRGLYENGKNGGLAMQGRRFSHAWLRGAAIVGGLVVAVAVMAWYGLNGGAQFLASRRAQVEECNVVLSGSATMGRRLAPALVSDFLAHGGYEVDAVAREGPDLVRISGRRDPYRCTVRVRTSESTNGFVDLANGAALIALSSRPILPADMARLQGRGAGDFEHDRALAEHVLGYDAVAIVVNDANPATDVSLDQLRRIVIGIDPNWIDFGGLNEPIHVYGPRELAGADDFPNDLVRSGARAWASAWARPNFHVPADDAATIDAIARDPRAIGFASVAFRHSGQGVHDLRVNAGGAGAAPTTSAVRSQAYSVMRRLFLYVRPRDMRENRFARAFIAYATSPNAYARIEEVGFFPLRPEVAAEAQFVRAIGCRIGAPEAATLASLLHGATRSETVLRFRANTTELDEAARANVERIAPSLTAALAAGGQVTLVGHSDAGGEATDNRALGLERAIAARAALEARGVLGVRVESAGEMCPLADTESIAGRRRNRRVEIWIRSVQAEPSSGGAR